MLGVLLRAEAHCFIQEYIYQREGIALAIRLCSSSCSEQDLYNWGELERAPH